ncbi:Ig-like domain-containing protein [Candidatus Nitrosotalea okcheonensis]|uniref:Uncharacterized protein n=1 Tax=Candidatus Nitrosotalea okcheonensis TaxID=1903276 RepID=A0A2H1FID7_9ARCH|nr:Ig-like domain-containing protein [Candidatus Nitrosotalea okcheonensis]SMH72529.1 exported protein of unknown function [Candidatus Nitrosotalea okcheonensis]
MLNKHFSYALILLAGTMIFPATSSFALPAPVAKSDSYKILENGILEIPAPGILANDISNGKTLSALLVSDVKNGTLMLNANGSLVYVPDPNFHGTDIFRYVASDGTAISNVENVTISVGQIVQSPVARNDSYMINENSTLSVSGSGVLSNDTNPNDRQMQAILVTNTINGHLSLNQNGNFTYIPNSGFYGMDSFTYEASDGLVTSNVATVTIIVKETGTQSGGNPFLVLLAQIQDLISRITGIENKISTLEQQNSALDSRVNQLEQEIQKIQSNPGIINNQQNDSQGDDLNNGDNPGNGEHHDNGKHLGNGNNRKNHED